MTHLMTAQSLSRVAAIFGLTILATGSFAQSSITVPLPNLEFPQDGAFVRDAGEPCGPFDCEADVEVTRADTDRSIGLVAEDEVEEPEE